MLKKINFLIIDDDDWSRVVKTLFGLAYLRYPVENALDDDENNMNYNVFTKSKNTASISNITFESALTHLKDDHKRYDFFFLDIDLANKNDPEFMAEAIVRFPMKEVNTLSKGEKSAFIAGLEFINRLQKDHRPKMFFSGSTEAKPFLNYISYVANRFDDVMFEDFDKGDLFLKEVNHRIDSYMLKRQRETCLHLDSGQAQLATEYMQEQDFDRPCITCLENHSDQWSLRTLFPKECNTIERLLLKSETNKQKLEERNNKIEGIVNNVKNIIFSFPGLLKEAAVRASHIDPNPGPDRQRQINKLIFIGKSLSTKEFEKEGPKCAVPFSPISQFLTNADEEILQTFIKTIYNAEWRIINKYEEFKSPDDLRLIISRYGLYPGYLDYIMGIIEHNINEKGQMVCLPLDVNKDNDLEICVKSKSDREINEKTLNDFQAKAMRTLNNNIFQSESAEGIQDIIKIVCFRYRGIYEVLTKVAGISFSLREGGLALTIKKGNDSLESNMIIQKIIIPELKNSDG